VNFIDTADVYSEGESEKHVGAALAALGRPRDRSSSGPRSAAGWGRGRTRSVFLAAT